MKYFFSVIFIGLFLLGNHSLLAQKGGQAGATKKSGGDTTSLSTNPILRDSLAGNDSLRSFPRQQVIIDSLKNTSDLKTTVIATADDSIVFDVENRMLYLYNKAKIDYEEMKVEADHIITNWKEQTITAEGKALNDSIGTIVGRPIFSQGDQNYTARKMSYNFKSKKGRIEDARTSEGDGFILAETVKRNADNSFYGLDGKYTTCDADHPHFYIHSRKMKVIPGSKIISGPLNLVLEDFPVPIIIPFGFFPNTKKHDSGIILPRYGAQGNRGMFLQDLGYFYGKSPYFNVLADVDLYTYGGWGAGLASRYVYQTRMSGGFAFDYQLTTFNESSDPDYQRKSGWKLNFDHQQSINQNTNISARVTIDKQFNRGFNPNVNFNQVLQNTQNSSISLNKSRIGNTPFSMNVSAAAVQDVANNTIRLDLPIVSLFMATQTPFKNISPKSSWDALKQLGIGYNLNASNQIQDIPLTLLPHVISNPNDSLFYVLNKETTSPDTIRKQGFEYYRNGLKHSIPISTKIKVFKYINISPSFSYNEYWYTQSIIKEFDTATNQPVVRRLNGFKTARDFSFNASANTIFYAFYGISPKVSKRNIVVRQVFTPSISYNYKPDFSLLSWGFFGRYTDKQNRFVKYSYFENSSQGAPTSGESQTLRLDLNTNLELKYLKKESFNPEFPEKEDKFERIRILDNFGISIPYNFAATRFKLGDINMNARASIFKNKFSINSGMIVSPYIMNGAGQALDTLTLKYSGHIGRVTGINLSFNTAFQSKQGAIKAKKQGLQPNQAAHLAIMRSQLGYVDFDIPWTLGLTYNWNYSRPGLAEPTISNVFNFNSDFSITPKWKIGVQSGYDIKKKDISQSTQFSVHRDLHCWEMAFTWTPLGVYQSYTLTLSVKSGTFKDFLLPTRTKPWNTRFREF